MGALFSSSKKLAPGASLPSPKLNYGIDAIEKKQNKRDARFDRNMAMIAKTKAGEFPRDEAEALLI
jgi:hypothetical protein